MGNQHLAAGVGAPCDIMEGQFPWPQWKFLQAIKEIRCTFLPLLLFFLAIDHQAIDHQATDAVVCVFRCFVHSVASRATRGTKREEVG